jgi:general secretion pathway protein G
MFNETDRCRQATRKAFTLVELVVVVLIIGILASVAAPKMFDTATQARESGTRQSLAVLRDAIELYRSQTGTYPAAASIETELASYIKGSFPSVQIGANKNNQVGEATGVGPITAVVAGGAGWAYNATTGDIVVNEGSYLSW